MNKIQEIINKHLDNKLGVDQLLSNNLNAIYFFNKWLDDFKIPIGSRFHISINMLCESFKHNRSISNDEQFKAELNHMFSIGHIEHRIKMKWEKELMTCLRSLIIL